MKYLNQNLNHYYDDKLLIKLENKLNWLKVNSWWLSMVLALVLALW